MTPTQKIKREILLQAIAAGAFIWLEEITSENMATAYDSFVEQDLHWDYQSDFRCSGIDTGLACEFSRHYESKAVAKKLSDGTWVGWTYWYGGGKHGEPEAIDWMGDAYEVVCTETEKMMVVREFKTVEACDG